MSGPVRPASARPRRDAPAEHDAVLPPTDDELDAIERHRIDWAAHLGASVTEDTELGLIDVRHDRPRSTLNYAARLRWPLEEFSERLAAVSERMKANGLWPSVVVCEGLSQPVDLPARLHAAGWLLVFGDRVMITRHAATVPHLDPGLRVEAVTPATALEAARIEAEVFGLHPDDIAETAELMARAVVDGRSRGFLLRLAREPIAAARLVPGPGVAGLHGVAVAARHRRRGYGRMITAVATRAGLATGHKLVWLSVDESNTAAVALYTSLGFAKSFTWTRWVAPAS
jgi:GNAT superfamily N-acetyltransferase